MNGKTPDMRGGRLARSQGRALCRRAIAKGLPKVSPPKPQARSLKDRVSVWIDENPKATAGDVVKAFDEFADASEYFAFRAGRLTRQPNRG